MSNWLEIEQAKGENIQWITALSARYKLAKQFLLLQALLVVALPVILYFDKLFIPGIATWAALYGLFVYFIDISVLEPQLMKNLKQGALAQEHFDCNVLQMDWNELGTDSQPSLADAIEWAGTFKYDDSEPWYSVDAGMIPPEMGRLICQLSSCMWDSRLRRRYATCLLVITIIIVVILLIIFIERPVENLVLAVAALLPVINWLFRSRKNQLNAAMKGERQKHHIEDLWARALRSAIAPVNLSWASRSIQDNIFRRRKDSQPVFDMVYRLFRDRDQTNMKAVAKAMVQEYQKERV